MLDQLFNYLNTNGGLLVILCLVVAVHLFSDLTRHLTLLREKAQRQSLSKDKPDRVKIAIRNLPPRMSNLHFRAGG
jgi:hypothetical protein